MPAPRTDGANPQANRKLPAEWLVLAAVLLVGLLLRVAYLRENLAKPEFTVPPIDAGFHDYWARALATGDWTPPHQFPDPQLSEHPYVRPPGYPYFLSLIYRFAGDSYLAPRIVQLALGLVNALLAFLLAARWFGRRVGLLWAALMSVYWIFIYLEGELQEPALLICLLLSLVYVLGLWAERRVFGYALAAGILLGLAGLVRPNVLLFAPVALAWGYWLRRRRARPRRLLLHAAGLVLGVGLTVAPVTVRNYLVAEDLVFVSSNAGVNLFIGNHQGSHGRFVCFLPGLGKFGTCYDYPAIVWNLERKLDRSLKYSEVSAWFADQAFRFIREHPARFVALTFHRAV